MWVPAEKIRTIENMRQSAAELEPLLKRAIDERGELLTDFCPRCGDKVKVKFLSTIGMFVKMCAHDQIVWVTPQMAEKVYGVLTSADQPQIPAVAQSRKKFIVLALVVVGFFIGLQAKVIEHTSKSTVVEHQQTEFPAELYSGKNWIKSWGARDYSKWYPLPNPIKDMDPAEYAYWQQWRAVMEEGITNRMNVQDALDSSHSAEEYLAILEEYRRRQENMINKLADFQPPERIRTFQDYVVQSGYDQLRFYDAYGRAKAENSQRKFVEFRNHPDLVAADKKLWAAYYNFQALYPQRDKAANDAIEQRLCWFDII